MQGDSDVERVRQYSSKQYIEPARKRGDATVRIVAGDVHKAVHISKPLSVVSRALKSRKFMDENGLALEKVERPASGTGATVTFMYRIKPSDTGVYAAQPQWPFLRLRGIAKDVFRSLGSGERFIRNERREFYR